MALDPKKLKTYLGAMEGRPGRPTMSQEGTPAKAAKALRPYLKPGQSPDELLGYLERGDEVTTEQLARLLDPKVSYMELAVAAKGFACGNCEYAGEGAVCRNPLVMAPVSAKQGCCNLFHNEDQIAFPPPEI